MRTLIAILILAATMACAEDVDVSYSKSIVIDGVDVHQIVMVIARDRAEVRVGMFPTKAGAKLEWPDRGEAVRVFAFPLDTVMAEYGKQSGTPAEKFRAACVKLVMAELKSGGGVSP